MAVRAARRSERGCAGAVRRVPASVTAMPSAGAVDVGMAVVGGSTMALLLSSLRLTGAAERPGHGNRVQPLKFGVRRADWTNRGRNALDSPGLLAGAYHLVNAPAMGSQQ